MAPMIIGKSKIHGGQIGEKQVTSASCEGETRVASRTARLILKWTVMCLLHRQRHQPLLRLLHLLLQRRAVTTISLSARAGHVSTSPMSAIKHVGVVGQTLHRIVSQPRQWWFEMH